ncbi:TPA: T6SS immunity protein Tli4 family protein [Pseudomonas aeruginosa]
MKKTLAALIFLSTSMISRAEDISNKHQECLGRMTFEVPEEMEWATYDASRVGQISKGGGHNFTAEVTAVGDNGSYDYDQMTFYISDKVERERFDGASNYIKGTSRLYQKELIKKVKIKEWIINDLKERRYGNNDIEEVKKEISELEEKIPLAKIYEHNLGIPDAHILGSKNIPFHVLLWRNQRVYYFTFSKPNKNSAQRIKDLVARFRTRELYEVPDEPGICFPYGFIADDGKTAYDLKNSLRFTRTPNVIFSLLTASANNPWQTRPTSGLYDSDFRPGYDRQKWKKSALLDSLHIGKRLAAFEGWRLDPRPDSGERERAWFGLAHTGGLLDPLVAIQVQTFQKGTDDLTDYTPPPEEVLPRLKALSQSIEQRLAR